MRGEPGPGPFFRAALVLALPVFFLFFACVNAAGAGTRPLGAEESRAEVERLGALQAGTDSMAALVRQRKTGRNQARAVNTEGSILLKKPNLLRWEIRSPERLTIVVDGSYMWVYRPRAGEARKRDLARDMVARYTTEFFTSALMVSYEDLSKRFNVAVYKENADTVLELVPKSTIALKYLKKVSISYRASDGMPERFVVEGQNGNVTTTEMGEIRTEVPAGNDDFRLDLPKDVKIIGPEDDETQ